MNVIGYDPYIRELPGITLYTEIKDVFKRADYISLHIPLSRRDAKHGGHGAFVVDEAFGVYYQHRPGRHH